MKPPGEHLDRSGVPRRATYSLLLGVIVGSGVARGGSFAVGSLLAAVDRGVCKRYGADLRSIADSVEQYKADRGHYPVTTDVAALAAAIEPDYIRLAPLDGVRYFSEGGTYTVDRPPPPERRVGPGDGRDAG